MRPIARTALLVLLSLLVGALAAGCGGSGASTSPSDRSSSKQVDDTSPRGEEVDGAQATAQLTIELKQVGSKAGGIPIPAAIACDKKLPATCSDELVCPAQEGDAQRAAICAWLNDAGLEALMAGPTCVPQPNGEELCEAEREVCTMQYGGPTTASVDGRVNGERIVTSFSRENGCAIARFEAASPLWTGEVPNAVPPPADGGGGAAAGACPVIEPDTPVSSDDAAGAAADQACPGAPPTAPGAMEPDVISDPPEAFE